MEYRRRQSFKIKGRKMIIKELNYNLKLTIEAIERNDKSFNAKKITNDLKCLYVFLNEQQADKSYKTLFDKKIFKSLMRSLFPSAPIGFSNYYCPKFTDTEKINVSKTQNLLSKIYNEMPSI